MPNALRYPLAVIVGWFVAIFLVASIEKIGHSIYPIPENLNVQNAEQMNSYIAELPVGALLFVLLAWFVATFVGGLLSCFIAKGRAMLMAFFIGFLIFSGALMSLMVIEHPWWFSILALLGIPVIVAYTGKFGQRFEKQSLHKSNPSETENGA